MGTVKSAPSNAQAQKKEDRGFFLQVPYYAIDLDLNPTTLTGFIRFCRLFNRKDKSVVYQGYYRGLARALNFSPNTTIKIVKEWVEHGLVIKEETPAGIVLKGNTAELWHKNKEYCSQHALASSHTSVLGPLHTMPYLEYLQTPEWEEKRKAALARAGYHCQVCNAGNTPLHVHHRTYIRRGYELDQDLITLCADCHQLFHQNGKMGVEA